MSARRAAKSSRPSRRLAAVRFRRRRRRPQRLPLPLHPSLADSSFFCFPVRLLLYHCCAYDNLHCAVLVAALPRRPSQDPADPFSPRSQIASEVSAAAVLVSYWTDITPALVISISLALILAINLMPVRFYGETEVVTACVKILCFLGLVVVSIVITAGGAPEGDAIGFRYWRNPGAFVDYNGASPFSLSLSRPPPFCVFVPPSDRRCRTCARKRDERGEAVDPC